MSKLKTAWDAVNELRGDLSNSYLFDTDDIYLFYCIDDSDYVCSICGAENINEKLVCTVNEFNALVEEMTLGLDVNPVNHGHYLNYVDADKALLKNENNPLVYTKEMANNGVLPPYGLLVQLRRDYGDDDQFYNGRLVADDRGVIWFDDDKYGGCLHSLNEVTLQPIDQRTKKEKAIDEIESELSKIAYSTRSALELAYDEWVGD